MTRKKAYVITAGLAIFFMAGSFFYGFLSSGGGRFFNVLDGKIYQPKTGEENKQSQPRAISDFEAEQLFFDVMKYIKGEYVDQDLASEDLWYGAINGMVRSLDDPYSVFLEPVASEEFHEELSGRFEGIGAEIGIRDDRLTVISPLSESPAEKAGVKAGDKIHAIDGEDTTDLSLESAVEKIRGPKGEKVVLTVLRGEGTEFRDIEIIRDTIKLVSTNWKKLDGQNIAYVQIKYFNQDTLPRFHEIAKEVENANPDGIILDLRNNPGGLLRTAIEVTSFWLGDDKIIVKEKYRDQKVENHTAQNRLARFKNIPTVVLINVGSASGSEIVAGALQDYDAAILVGTKSFGKGSVQDLREFQGGSSVKLTIAKWLTPLDRQISGEGIEPDVNIELTIEDYENNMDPQLDEAIRILSDSQLKLFE